MKTNDKNNFSKRTANNVNAILKANGVDLKAENCGEGNLFCIYENTLKLRIAIKQAGFILNRSEENDKTLYFSCN